MEEGVFVKKVSPCHNDLFIFVNLAFVFGTAGGVTR